MRPLRGIIMGRAVHLKTFTAIAMVLAAIVGGETALAQQQPVAREETLSVTERPRPEYDPLGLRFGGFEARPSLDLEIEQNDNLFASETNEESDVIYVARPRVQIASTWSRHLVAIDAGAEHRAHQDFDSEDKTTGYVAAEGRLDVLRSTELTLNLRAAQAVEPRTSPDSPPTAGEPVEFSEQMIRVGGRHAFNRVRVGASYEERTLDYDDVNFGAVVLDQDNRDRTEKAVTARVEYAVSPRLALVAQATDDKREYDDPVSALTRDSEGRTYLVGANFDVTNLIRGEITAGAVERDYDDPALGTVDGTAISAAVEWLPTQLISVNLNAAQSVEDAGFEVVGGAASFLRSVAGVRVDFELRRNVILSAGGQFGRREYEGIDREDDIAVAEIGARYLMNRRVVLGGGYRFEREDSTGIDRGREFEQNRIFFTVGLRI